MYYNESTEGIDQPFRKKIGIHCGTVVDNYLEERQVKHGYTMDYYLKVAYPDKTVVERVSGEIWHDKRVGDNICFTVYESINGVLAISAILTFILLLMGIVIGLVYFVCWVFDVK